MPSEEDKPFSRTKLFGLDIVTVTDSSRIEAVGNLPEVERVAGVHENPDRLPWLFRWYFPKTRFYNPALRGWFLPFRAADDPTYAPCRAFLDKSFATPRDTSAAVSATADLLTDANQKASDRDLSDAAIRAIWAYIVPPGHPPIPEKHLAAAFAQVGGITDSLLPWKLLRDVPSTASVYAYVDGVLKSLGLRGGDGSGNGNSAGATTAPLPDAAVTDTAHVLFATAMNAPQVLRRLAELRPGEDVRTALCALGPTEQVVRMVKEDSTLGGLLPDDAPARRGHTMVIFNIRAGAAQTGDLAFVFGAGPGQRQCAARGVLERYFEDVRAEVARRRGAENVARSEE